MRQYKKKIDLDLGIEKETLEERGCDEEESEEKNPNRLGLHRCELWLF